MSFGKVVKRSYQLYLLQERDRERMAKLRGLKVEEKPVGLIREEFENKFGTRFETL